MYLCNIFECEYEHPSLILNPAVVTLTQALLLHCTPLGCGVYHRWKLAVCCKQNVIKFELEPLQSWMVVSTPLKNISQLGWLFPIHGKINNVPNHQSESNLVLIHWSCFAFLALSFLLLPPDTLSFFSYKLQWPQVILGRDPDFTIFCNSRGINPCFALPQWGLSGKNNVHPGAQGRNSHSREIVI